MIAQEFEYTPASRLQEALTLVAEGAKPLAGGMSLVPMMKLRLAAPEHLVDIARIPELNYIRQDGGVIRIGATTTHYTVQASQLLLTVSPLLARTAARIGDVQVRNSGTIGGSVAHADPAADYPAALFALEAQVRLASAASERVLPISEFLLDSFTTALEPGEIVTEISVPVEPANTGSAYIKMEQAASGFALVGAAARVTLRNGVITMARLGLTGVGAIASRASAVEAALQGQAASEEVIARASLLAAEGIEASSDLHASAGFRRHLASVCTGRALRAAVAEARGNA